MEKMNNKGFSLVELIIVIAIMAILAGALAPALLKYVAGSRRSSDISNGQTIATAVETAYTDESATSFGDVALSQVSAIPTTAGTVGEIINNNLTGGVAKFADAKTTKYKTAGSTGDTTHYFVEATYNNSTAKTDVKVYVAKASGDCSADNMVYPTVGKDMEK